MTAELKGGFTLPGESGYEELTLKLADKWGADVIRDSDGTKLSDRILKAGYGIYSTICIIRGHNEWANHHMDKLQQTFLITNPKTAAESFVTFHLMRDFSKEQFQVNDSPESMQYWQVYDRTSEMEVSRRLWTYEKEAGNLTIQNAVPYHKYTVSFLAYRIWEEISMYNHVTNGWNQEHLMPVDPRYVETQSYLLKWMEDWCSDHPYTTVVRFTSMFYNFAWIWGSSERNRSLFTDWGSYDFTVSPLALQQFASKYGYQLCAEDFVNKGAYQAAHMPPNSRKLDYMNFINDFVINFGKKLVDIVHSHGKQAYVFYDDSWVGVEPYGKRFPEFGFDGLIKCVFSGYEARLCAGVKSVTHELRLHPYLFPVGLGGAPTFSGDGDPALEAKKYWNQIRRALLRVPVQRIGLGGYLHLTEDYPEFCRYVEQIAKEFRQIRKLHEEGTVYQLNCRVAILHSWGSLRSWTLSGHFHETETHDLVHVLEALSGLPVEVSFLDFEDIKNGALDGVQVLINAGRAKSAWSGGEAWRDARVVEQITKWAYEGGTFLGIGEPSAVDGFDTFFRLSEILGTDKDQGARVCHGRWQYPIEKIEGLLPKGAFIQGQDSIYLTDGKSVVLAEDKGVPALTVRDFGNGKGIYLSSFCYSLENTRMFLNLLLYGTGQKMNPHYVTANPYTECAYFPKSKVLVIINNSKETQRTSVSTEFGTIRAELEGFGTRIMEL